MANHPCFGILDCPNCKRPVPVFWNGNLRIPCPYCNKKFAVRRQKLRNVKPYKGPITREETA